MDTFLDKLSARLNAQEMIRANGAAETEEMNVLKSQVSEYQACLDRMKAVSNELNGLHDQLSTLSITGPSMSEEAMAALGEIREAVNQMSETTGAGIESMKQELSEKLSSSDSDEFHKEGVRLYRNVQAALQEESKKVIDLLEQMQEKQNRICKKVSGLKGISITALVLAAVSLAGQIFWFLDKFVL